MGAADRVVTGQVRDEDGGVDVTLRPKRLVEYIGQDRVKDNLVILIAAALKRGDVLDHVLLYGPPGLGKTTLAGIIAGEMGVAIKITSGPAIERQGDLVSILTNLNQGDVLFIDEIHRLNRQVEEVLYAAMEDFVVDIIIGKGPAARSMRLSLPRFTLVGATTRLALLTSPLRDRFGAVYRLDYYDPVAMRLIVARSARILDTVAEANGVNEIARRARGTPRIANRLLRRVRDYAQVRANSVIDEATAVEALDHIGVTGDGLDEVDRRIMDAVVNTFAGGPVGIETLAAATSEEADTIMDVYEPYLIQLGLLQRTPRGRQATELAFQRFGKAEARRAARAAQASLFDVTDV